VLRPGVVEAVAECHRAGIGVKMITGDHAPTAAAIGRDLGVVGESPPMTGSEVGQSSDEELRERVRTTDVFARVAPEQKTVLRTDGLGVQQWAPSAAAGAVVVPVVAAEKRWSRRRAAPGRSSDR
jgi:hypothetical protein